MGHKLTASEETRLLQDTIRQGHELLGALLAAIKEARTLETDLVQQFETVANREIGDLSRQLQEQNNLAAAQLNTEVEIARREIVAQLTMLELEQVPETGVLRVTYAGGRFDDQATTPIMRVVHERT